MKQSKRDAPDPGNLYPIFLEMNQLPVLVVGAGEVALRKVKGLLACGAQVTVVSPAFNAAFAELQEAQKIRCFERRFRRTDLKNKAMIFAATDDEKLNGLIAENAKGLGLLVNVAAPPEAGNFVVPSSFRKGPLCVAVSTSGASAAAGKQIRQSLEKTIDPSLGKWLELLGEYRQRIKAEIASKPARSGILKMLGEERWPKQLKKVGVGKIRKELDALIEETKFNLKSKAKGKR